MSIQSEITRIASAKSDIADAIEYKGVTVPGGSKIDDMAALIRQIRSGGATITETQDPAGGTVISINAEEILTITPLSVSSNGTYTANSGYAYNPVTVSVAQTSSNFVVTLSYNSQTQEWEPDCTFSQLDAARNNGKNLYAILSGGSDCYSFAWINHDGIQSYYIGIYSNYAEHAWAYIWDQSEGFENDGEWDFSSGSEGTPVATKGTVSNHSITVTPSVTNTAGIISGGTHTGTAVSVSASELVSGTYSVTSSGTKDVTNYASASIPAGTATAPSSISGTSATVSTGTNTLTLTKSVSVTPNVTTAGYISSGTAGNASVSLTASVTTKAAATITPGTTNQTIASGTYLTGTQTIAGDADLVAGNILSTANIFGVQGSVVIQHYYTGSTTPSSSLGSNGDIYLKTS